MNDSLRYLGETDEHLRLRLLCGDISYDLVILSWAVSRERKGTYARKVAEEKYNAKLKEQEVELASYEIEKVAARVERVAYCKKWRL